MSSPAWSVPAAAVALGFSNTLTGASTSRTVMLPELRALFAATSSDAGLAAYQQAVVEENALAKPTRSTRSKTFAYLRDRYGLDPSLPIFRALRDLWAQDASTYPLMATSAALARDPILRTTADLVLGLPPESPLTWEQLASEIDAAFPGRLNPTTLKSTAQNAAASWRQAGHLRGVINKVRRRVEPHPTSVAYALLLGHLCGDRGDALFTSNWARVLDAPPHALRDLALVASRQGWIDYRHAGAVTEVGFRHLLGKDGARA